MKSYSTDADSATRIEPFPKKQSRGDRKQKVSPAAKSRDPLWDYIERDRILQSLGFKSYTDYLDSALWKSIHRKVVKSSDYVCQVCHNAPALQVHHRKYTRSTLLGTSLIWLVATCLECHRQFEHTATGTKTTLRSANKRMKRLKKSKSK